MTLSIETFVLGPIENNTYLIKDEVDGVAAIIDPAAPSQELANALKENSCSLKYIWLTHAHFDHIGGVKFLKREFGESVSVVLHEKDLELWKKGGGSADFGFDFDAGDPPDFLVEHQTSTFLGKHEFLILHTPGHTQGHLTYYSADHQIAFVGDLIFYHGIGRTDLDVSNDRELFTSIKEKIFTLPDKTILYPGHGPKTNVAEEKRNNPFV